MTERDDAGTADLRTALQQALSGRDRRTSAPSYEALTAQKARAPRPFEWRPALAIAAATLIVVAGVLTWKDTDDAQAPMLDARLVEQLSPPSYWRVPSDELLAYAPSPVSLDIDIDTGLPVSLEESLL